MHSSCLQIISTAKSLFVGILLRSTIFTITSWISNLKVQSSLHSMCQKVLRKQTSILGMYRFTISTWKSVWVLLNLKTGLRLSSNTRDAPMQAFVIHQRLVAFHLYVALMENLFRMGTLKKLHFESLRLHRPVPLQTRILRVNVNF